jgi:hypothetical protein
VLAAVLIVGLLAVVLLQFTGHSAPSTGPSGQPTATQPIPTQTPPASTATATASPTPPAAQTWTTIQAFTASGNYQSANFTVTSPWRLVWQCNTTMGNPGPYPLQVDVVPSTGSGGTTRVLDAVCRTGNTSGTSAEQTSPTGLVHLQVHSAADGEWDVRVQVLR